MYFVRQWILSSALVGVVAMTSQDSSIQSLAWPLPHLSIDAARSLRRDLTLEIQRDKAEIQVLTGKLLSKDDERDDLERRRDDLTLRMNEIEEGIDRLGRVVLSKKEERDELDEKMGWPRESDGFEIDDMRLLDEPSDDVEFGPPMKTRKLGKERTSKRTELSSQEPPEGASRRAAEILEEAYSIRHLQLEGRHNLSNGPVPRSTVYIPCRIRRRKQKYMRLMVIHDFFVFGDARGHASRRLPRRVVIPQISPIPSQDNARCRPAAHLKSNNS